MADVKIDDLTEELIRSPEDGGTWPLEWAGERVELDLTVASKEKLDEILAPYLAAGRAVQAPRATAPSGSRSGSRAPKPAADVPDGEIRAWAAERGVECQSHGRVPREVRQAYADEITERANVDDLVPPAPALTAAPQRYDTGAVPDVLDHEARHRPIGRPA